MATQKGHTDVVEALIAAGCDVNQADMGGWTPFRAAVYYDHHDTADSSFFRGRVDPI